MLRRLILVAACLLMSMQLGAADEKTKGKLSIWLGYPETLDAFKLGQAEFKKKWPNVDVEILTFELREFEARFCQTDLEIERFDRGAKQNERIARRGKLAAEFPGARIDAPISGETSGAGRRVPAEEPREFA